MLSGEHAALMYESGICDECVQSLSVNLVVETVDKGMIMRYPDTDGFHRIRLDEPTGKQRYTQPAGTGVRLYFCPGYDRWTHGMEPIFITEGERKALSLACRLRNRAGVVGLGGVWNWTGGRDRDKKVLAGDFSKVNWKGRAVYIVFDSDAASNRDVLAAEAELARALSDKGARVKIVVLGPERKGIDDWLYVWTDGWERELTRLCKEARPTREQRLHAVYDRVYSFQDMLSQRFPVPIFYCGDSSLGIAGQGMITLIHGPTNVGKTYLTTQLAISIATGQAFLGHECRESKVLALQGELPPGLYAQSRLRPVAQEQGIPKNLSFYNWAFNLAESSRFKETFTGEAWTGFDRLESMLDEHSPDVVVIDPVQSYHNLVETSNDQLRELMKKLKAVAIGRNIGFVLVDHDRKSSGDGNLAVRGASAKTDLVDCVLGISRADDGVLLSYDKIRYISAPLPNAREIHMEGCWFYDGWVSSSGDHARSRTEGGD